MIFLPAISQLISFSLDLSKTLLAWRILSAWRVNHSHFGESAFFREPFKCPSVTQRVQLISRCQRILPKGDPALGLLSKTYWPFLETSGWDFKLDLAISWAPDIYPAPPQLCVTDDTRSFAESQVGVWPTQTPSSTSVWHYLVWPYLKIAITCSAVEAK